MARHIYQGTFKDQNGAVVGSSTTSDSNPGVVTVYLSGTETLADVYEAATGGTSVNSVSTDEFGFFSFWVDDADYALGQLFKIVLTHRDFVPRTYSNIDIIRPTESYITSLITTETAPTTILRFQVQPNHTIKAPDGDRFIVRGVQMFDYLFCSFEARDDYTYRTIYEPAGKGAGTGISEPTYYARVSYISEANVEEQIKTARDNGVNLIRLGAEYAMMRASVSYVDPTDGLTYLSDPDMLDIIINIATRYEMVVQIQCSRDEVETADNIVFLKWLAERYYNNPYVWINPANEINGTVDAGADVSDPVVWAAEMRQYVLALREDITGLDAGTKFLNPVCIDPPAYAYRLDLVETTLTTDVAFTEDPNLIINIHVYSTAGQDSFRLDALTDATTYWYGYVGTFCIVVGEFGIDNFAGRYDPNIDDGVPSVDETEWAKMQLFTIDASEWFYEQTLFGQLNGVIGNIWYAYIPGLAIHDDNTMRLTDGSWTTWGEIYRDHYLSPVVTPLRSLRGLGADFTTGQWGTGYIQNDAVTNDKLGNMATGTIKGRITTGTDTPEDLTTAQVLNLIANLNISGRISQGAIGTPTFQAEGTTGVKAGGVFISQGVSDIYVGFYNRTTGLLTGQIIGNGTTGVSYATVSDARLKTNPKEVDAIEALALFDKLRPVKAGWKSQPDLPEELVFMAHEAQEAVPQAVTGNKKSDIMQTLDYGRLTPVITAALKVALKRIDDLEAKLANLKTT